MRGKDSGNMELMIKSNCHCEDCEPQAKQDEAIPKREIASPLAWLAMTSFVIFVLCFGICHSLYAENIKEPDVAGAFYPGDPVELSAMIDGFLSAANPEKKDGQIFGLICPHAGYGFSGQTAAFGYKLIQDKPYKTVVIIGVSHFYGFGGISVYPQGKFRTPLGDLEIDSEFAKKLLNREEGIVFDPEAFKNEHSVEVQLPFLQKVLSDFKIVPIITGDTSFSTYQKLAQLLKQEIASRQGVLVIASCDLYHGYDYQDAQKYDELTLSSIKNMDAEGIYNALRQGNLEFKDGFPAIILLMLAKDMGCKTVRVLSHTNSAVVTGKKIKGVWTVGYSSCALDKEDKENNMLNQAQRKKLLEIARGSLEEYLKTGKKMNLSEADPVLVKEMGAFVTLKENDELRGCIGNLIATGPLYLTVRDMAVEAAVGDPRFAAVELAELKKIEIEISVLSPMEKVDSADRIELGKHGVLVRKGMQSGVFLPQVAAETGWNKEEFLSNLCLHKAGLAPDAWKDKSTEIYIFTAEVFSEKEYK